jgi:hypothetical protein
MEIFHISGNKITVIPFGINIITPSTGINKDGAKIIRY